MSSSSQEQERQLTAESLYRLPDDGWRYELIEGWLVSEPLPKPRHGRVVSRVCARLETFASAHGLGAVYAGDAGFVLRRGPDTVRGPDVAFVSRARVAAIEDPDRYIEGAPDLAVEVRSFGDRTGEVHAKVADYLAAGCPLVWVVDPAKLTVTVYHELLAPDVIAADGELSGEDVLPGFSAPVSELFEP